MPGHVQRAIRKTTNPRFSTGAWGAKLTAADEDSADKQFQKINRQIAMMQFQMQSIQAGIFSAWEVSLYSGLGNFSPPRWVVVTARNSEIAANMALQQNPGFIVVPVRRVSF